jgi:hypothetical protein
MGECFISRRGGVGGGGAGMNVVTGLSEPASAKENMIWVKSDKAGKKYVFSEAAPQSPEDGLIWLVSTAAGIMASCRVYADSTWARVDASFYTGGAWRQFSWAKRYLIQGGVPQVSFVANGAPYKSGMQYNTAKAPTIVGTIDGYYQMSLSAQNANVAGLVVTDKRVSLSDFSTLSCIAKHDGLGYKDMVMLNTKKPEYIMDAALETTSPTNTESQIDISLADYDANAAFVGFAIAIGAGNNEWFANVYVKDLWLE